MNQYEPCIQNICDLGQIDQLEFENQVLFEMVVIYDLTAGQPALKDSPEKFLQWCKTSDISKLRQNCKETLISHGVGNNYGLRVLSDELFGLEAQLEPAEQSALAKVAAVVTKVMTGRGVFQPPLFVSYEDCYTFDDVASLALTNLLPKHLKAIGEPATVSETSLVNWVESLRDFEVVQGFKECLVSHGSEGGLVELHELVKIDGFEIPDNETREKHRRVKAQESVKTIGLFDYDSLTQWLTGIMVGVLKQSTNSPDT